MKFSPDYLLQQLRRHPEPPAYQVAYSGGLDSHALLHALCSLRAELDADIRAVHVNHGLQQDADRWESHCREVCADLKVEYVSLRVDGKAMRGESPEAAARSARYTALADWLPAQHCLLTAQHQDDQAETLLLQLLRGSGVNGLAAMPVVTASWRRPPPASLACRYPGVSCISMSMQTACHGWRIPVIRILPSIAIICAQQVLPVLRERWPAVTSSLSRSASHCADAAHLLEELGEQDLHNLASRESTLSLTGLLTLLPSRQSNVLRHWIKQLSGKAAVCGGACPHNA